MCYNYQAEQKQFKKIFRKCIQVCLFFYVELRHVDRAQMTLQCNWITEFLNLKSCTSVLKSSHLKCLCNDEPISEKRLLQVALKDHGRQPWRSDCKLVNNVTSAAEETGVDAASFIRNGWQFCIRRTATNITESFYWCKKCFCLTPESL